MLMSENSTELRLGGPLAQKVHSFFYKTAKKKNGSR
jgi:hypothetical protein